MVAADAKDRDDVRMVKLAGRLGLDLEPLALLGVDGGREGEHLQGHAPAERELPGLVDHAHPAAPHLAEKIVVAQPGMKWQDRLGPLPSLARCPGY